MHSNKCPRGFKWCDQRQECIPERNGEKVHQVKGRYFFKGDGYMDKNTQYASEVVDMAFDEGFEVFTKLKIAEKKIERLLDMCGKHHTSECGTMEDDTAPEDSDEEYVVEPPVTGANKIDHVPNQHFGTLYSSIRKQIGEIRQLTKEGKEEYREYFQKMLKKYGVSSPAELDAEKKKAFFNAVDKGWKTHKEVSESIIIAGIAGLIAAGAVKYAWYRSDVKSCKRRFADDKPNLVRCLTHYKHCARFAPNKRRYEECLKNKAVDLSKEK